MDKMARKVRKATTTTVPFLKDKDDGTIFKMDSLGPNLRDKGGVQDK
jgi:hypothetical protein